MSTLQSGINNIREVSCQKENLINELMAKITENANIVTNLGATVSTLEGKFTSCEQSMNDKASSNNMLVDEIQRYREATTSFGKSVSEDMDKLKADMMEDLEKLKSEFAAISKSNEGRSISFY